MPSHLRKKSHGVYNSDLVKVKTSYENKQKLKDTNMLPEECNSYTVKWGQNKHKAFPKSEIAVTG